MSECEHVLDQVLKALKLAVTVMEDNYIDESMAGEFETFIDAIKLAEKFKEK